MKQGNAISRTVCGFALLLIAAPLVDCAAASGVDRADPATSVLFSRGYACSDPDGRLSGGTALDEAAMCPFNATGSATPRTDPNDHQTIHIYDLTRNLEISRTEGLAASGSPTPRTRTISTEWHPTFALPTRVAEPLRITTSVYDSDGTQCGARGALCSKTIQPTTDPNGSQGFAATPTGTARTWSYTYDAGGQVLTIEGPRAGVADAATLGATATALMLPR